MTKPNKEALKYFVDLLKEGKMEYRDGEVWKLWEPRRNWLENPRRAEKLSSNGYYLLRTTIKSAGNPLYVMAHRVIWQYHNGEIPDEMVINHKNGIKTDNRIENLEVVTQRENIRHALDTGLTRVPLGLERPNTRLSDWDIRMVKTLTESGVLLNREIAQFYGIAAPYVSQIKHGKGRTKFMTPEGWSFNEYQEKSKRTLQNLTKEEALKNYSMGLSGEIGEIIDLLKKHLYHGHELDQDKVQEEIGDAIFYISAIATTLGASLDDIALGNVEKLIKRYPQGFDQAASIARVDTK